jgi:Domain of unknown function (DUF6458)
LSGVRAYRRSLSVPKEQNVGIGVSVFLLAVGAIMTFALEASADGINLDTVGIILMIVGALGLLLSLFVIESWRRRPGYGGSAYREERVVRDDPLL